MGLIHRGGLRVEVLKDGLIRVGDVIEPGGTDRVPAETAAIQRCDLSPGPSA